jgi:Uma2 family endonuclease
MATQTTEKLLTAEEFYKLPDPPHGGRMELWEGRVRIEMPVGRPHSRRAFWLILGLGPFVEANGLGELHIELGYRLRRSPDIVFAPDVSFVDQAGLLEEAPPGFINRAPVLAVEVTSPDDTEREVLAKVATYLQYGTERVWVVRERQQTVTVHRADGTSRVYGIEDSLDSDDAGFALEGFSMRVADIFAR